MSKHLYEKLADQTGYINLLKYDLKEGDYHHIMPHFHNANEVVFVKEGEYFVKVGEEERVLKTGEMAFIGSFIPHSYKFMGKATIYTFVFSKDIVDALLKGKVFPTFMEKNDAYGLLDIICNYTSSGWDVGDHKFKSGIVNAFLGVLIASYPLVDKPKDGVGEFVAEVMKYLDENYKEDVSLKKLADNFGYTESYFSRRFNNFTGMSLREYLNRKRVKEAVKLHAENPNLPLSKIAVMVGFTCLNTFYRVYYKYIEEKN